MKKKTGRSDNNTKHKKKMGEYNRPDLENSRLPAYEVEMYSKILAQLIVCHATFYSH